MNPLLIDVPVPILTPRLLLCPPRAGDGALLYEVKLESWADLSRWSIWAFGKAEDATREDDEIFCRERQAKFILRETMTLLIFNRHSGDLIGGGGISKPDWQRRIFTIGYWIRSSRTRHGYATEAAAALTRYAFEALAATKIMSHHEAGNDASKAVLQKLGFVQERVRPDFHTRPDGTKADDYLYSCTDLKGVPKVDVQWRNEASSLRFRAADI